MLTTVGPRRCVHTHTAAVADTVGTDRHQAEAARHLDIRILATDIDLGSHSHCRMGTS